MPHGAQQVSRWESGAEEEEGERGQERTPPAEKMNIYNSDAPLRLRNTARPRDHVTVPCDLYIPGSPLCYTRPSVLLSYLQVCGLSLRCRRERHGEREGREEEGERQSSSLSSLWELASLLLLLHCSSTSRCCCCAVTTDASRA